MGRIKSICTLMNKEIDKFIIKSNEPEKKKPNQLFDDFDEKFNSKFLESEKRIKALNEKKHKIHWD